MDLILKNVSLESLSLIRRCLDSRRNFVESNINRVNVRLKVNDLDEENKNLFISELQVFRYELDLVDDLLSKF